MFPPFETLETTDGPNTPSFPDLIPGPACLWRIDTAIFWWPNAFPCTRPGHGSRFKRASFAGRRISLQSQIEELAPGRKKYFSCRAQRRTAGSWR